MTMAHLLTGGASKSHALRSAVGDRLEALGNLYSYFAERYTLYPHLKFKAIHLVEESGNLSVFSQRLLKLLSGISATIGATRLAHRALLHSRAAVAASWTAGKKPALRDV